MADGATMYGIRAMKKLLKKLECWEQKFWVRLLLFALMTALLMYTAIALNDDSLVWDQPFDAYDYDAILSERFVNDEGEFSLTHYPQQMRGYLYPLLLHGFHQLPLEDPNAEILLMNCMALAWFLVWGCRPFLEGLKHRWRRAAGVMLFTAFFMTAWTDLLHYALTDLHGFLALYAALLCFRCATMPEKSRKAWMKYGWLLLSGVLLYATYNFRPSNQFAVLLFLVGLTVWTALRFKERWGFLLAVVLGVLLCALPQMIICYDDTQTLSLLLPTEEYDGQGLTMFYLNNGLLYRRYETYIGPPVMDEYSGGAIYFLNPDMIALMEIMGIGEMSSLGEYLEFVFTYPVETLITYVHHLVNLCTPMFGAIFVEDLYCEKMPLILLHFALMFSTAADWFLRTRDGQKPWSMLHDKKLLLICFICLIPVLIAIPGKVETRYALPAYMFLYLYAACRVRFVRIVHSIRRHPFMWFAAVVSSAVVYLVLVNDTVSNISGLVLTMM